MKNDIAQKLSWGVLINSARDLHLPSPKAEADEILRYASEMKNKLGSLEMNCRRVAKITSEMERRLRLKLDSLDRAKGNSQQVEYDRQMADFLGRLSKILLKLVENLNFVQWIGEKLAKGEQKSLGELALLQNISSIREVLPIIEEIKVESFWNVKTIKNLAVRLSAIFALSGAVGAVDYIHDKAEKSETIPIDTARSEKSVPKVRAERPFQMRKGLRKMKAGESYTPGINSIAESGESDKKGERSLKVEFPPDSDIDDSFFATDNLVRAEGQFVVVNPYQKISTIENKIQAKVNIPKIMVNPDVPIALPAPIGYAATNIKTIPAVKFVVDIGNRAINFDKAGVGQEVSVIYDVVRVNMNPVDSDRAPYAVSEMVSDLTTAQTKSEIRLQLDNKLKDFYYVTSDDLNEILDMLPGDPGKKTAKIGIGDCDTLSIYASDLLNQAGKKSWLIMGYENTAGQIHLDQPHAKVAYFNEAEQRVVSYESTTPVKNSFRNVTLDDSDKQALLQHVTSMRADTNFDPDFTRLREKIAMILGSGKYDEKAPAVAEKDKGQVENIESKVLSEIAGEAQKKIADVLNIEVGDAKELSKLLALFGSLILGFLSVNKGARRILEKEYGKTEGELKQIVNSIIRNGESRETTRSDAAEDEERLLRLQIKGMVEQEGLKNLDLEDIDSMPLQVKRDLALLLGIYQGLNGKGSGSTTIGRLFHFIGNIRSGKVWSEIVMAMPEESKKLEDLLTQLHTVVRAKNDLRQEITGRENEIESARIMQEGKELYARMMKDCPSTVKKRTDYVRDKLLTPVDVIGRRSGDKTNPKKGRVGASMDFFDHVPYEQGMDMKHVDWDVSQRIDKIVVKRTEEEAGRKKEQTSFDLVIDVSTLDPDSLRPMTALLIYAHYHKDVTIGSIYLSAFGKVVNHLTPEKTQKLTAEGNKSIAFLVNKVLSEASNMALDKMIGYDTDELNNLLKAVAKNQVRGVARKSEMIVVGGVFSSFTPIGENMLRFREIFDLKPKEPSLAT